MNKVRRIYTSEFKLVLIRLLTNKEFYILALLARVVAE